MKKKKFLLLSIVVIALLALVAGGTVLGQEPEEPEELPPLPNATPEVPVDEEEQAGVLPAAAVDAAFTYQGRLTDSGGSPVSDGQYDFEVQFWDDPDPTAPGAVQVGATIAAADTVSNGLFELTLPVTHDDFNGQELYLRMRIRPDGGTWDAWTDTQPILPVPYALSLRPGATIGGTGAGDGRLFMRDSANNTTLRIDSAPPDTSCLAGAACTEISGGQHSVDGDLEFESNDDMIFILDGDHDNTHEYFFVYKQLTADTVQKLFQVDHVGNCGADGTFTSNAWDYADVLPVAGSASELEPGDVLVISKSQDRAVELSPKSFDTSVIGIYSTKPGFLGGVGLGTQVVNGVPVALAGIVPCKVSAENGPIQRGDLLTTSSTPGHAMRAGETPPLGTVLGKAMGELAEGTGTIEVLVMLQ
jgi:hypothetical protein